MQQAAPDNGRSAVGIAPSRPAQPTSATSSMRRKSPIAARQYAQGRTPLRQSPRQRQHVAKDGVENELLHHRRPFEQREKRPRILEDARLFDHVHLDVGARMDRQTVGLDEQQDKKGEHEKKVCRTPVHGGLCHQQMVHDERQHGFGEQRNADQHQDQCRLRENAKHDRAA